MLPDEHTRTSPRASLRSLGTPRLVVCYVCLARRCSVFGYGMLYASTYGM